jgi:hypothetical protein
MTIMTIITAIMMATIPGLPTIMVMSLPEPAAGR